ncbi:MAG: lysophospholipid acyltransferase family protein [Actinomycetota bacterium]
MSEIEPTTDAETKPAKEAKSIEWATDVQRSRAGGVFYWLAVRFFRLTLMRWLRVKKVGSAHLDIDGPVILAPVHRSNLDSIIVACTAKRRLRAIGKDSLFTNTAFAWINSALGAIPVRRGEADRAAIKASQEIIADGAMMIVFPEGTRQRGHKVEGVFDGTTYLAQKTGAPIIPIGIGGTEAAMASGSKGIKRVRCSIVVGEPIPAPVGRMSQPQRREFSENVVAELQRVFDEAIALADG